MSTLEETVDKQVAPQKEQLISESEMGDGKDEKKSGSDTREYLVFQEGNTNQWIHVGSPVAANAGAAILAVENPKEGARYAAVPARNWTVAKPKVKVETTVSLEFE